MTYNFTVNGEAVQSTAPGLRPLLTVLRDELGLRGSKEGCGEGRCGACTVLIDDQPVASCLYPAALVDGRDVRTVEGLAGPEQPLNALQDALLEHGGVQCGACIPGVIMSLTALLESGREVTERSVREALVGNICRCTGYQKIVDAALATAQVA
jgi:aerobic-type carbon monoxide dehydrogenase small subunit (CoxS/CutS family)